MFNVLNLIGHLSNALYAIGSGFKNVMYFRASLILAGLLEIIYYSSIAVSPIWTPILWSAALIIINTYQILRVVYQKKFLNFSEDELKALVMIGDKMDILNFKKIMRAGTWEYYPEQKNIITQNEASEKIFFLVEGEAEVIINNKQVSKIKKGNFIGEMSFLTGELPSANVFALTGSKLICWHREKLRRLMKRNHALKHEIHFLFSNDLISKLNNQNKRNIL